ncbi:hypothetical protein ACQBAR_05755 [Propionibacteriaceae bacterium Y1685]
MMLNRLSDLVAAKVLGTTEAAAAPCEGPYYYQYRCVWKSAGYYSKQRRRCYRDRCASRTYCGSYSEISCC